MAFFYKNFGKATDGKYPLVIRTTGISLRTIGMIVIRTDPF